MTWIDYKKTGFYTVSKFIKYPTNCTVYREDYANLDSGGQSLADVKIQSGIFQGDALSPLSFGITMMLLNHIFRKSIARYKLRKSQEKINRLKYMDNIKHFAKNKKNWKL